ncbi:MAG: HNH endonuclease domain-containing protein [Candidatus Helarchaeota archaeon]
MTLIKDINTILEYGRKTTSYKYITLLGIFDYIIEHPSDVPINNFHFIPIIYLAKQFLSYYYPYSFYEEYQESPSGGKLKIINFIDEFKDKFDKLDYDSKDILVKIKTLKEKGIFYINLLYELPEKLPDLLIRLMWQIRKRILEQPLQYIHNVNGEIIRFFGLMTKGIPFNSTYETHREVGAKQSRPDSMVWTEFLKNDPTCLLIDNLTYQKLSYYRFWAREVVLKAWFEYLMDKKSRQLSEPLKIELYRLMDYANNIDHTRNPSLISHYRDLYSQIGVLTCIYSGKNFVAEDKFHLDHFLPWVYYPINRFWNLFVADSSINLQKSNLLPELKPELEKRIHDHLQICLNSKSPIIKNDLQYFYTIVQKQEKIPVNAPDRIEAEISNYLKEELNNLLEIIPGKLFSY